MISGIDLLSNLLNTSIVLFFCCNILISRINLDGLSFLENISKQNGTNTFIFMYIVLFFILLIKWNLNFSIIKNFIKTFKTEACKFFLLFSVDKKILYHSLRTTISELLLATLFCKRKFSTLSTSTFVFFMFFKTLYTPCLEKIKTFRNSSEYFSEKLQLILIIFFLGLLYFQVLLHNIILQFYRRRIINVIIGSEILHLNSIVRMVIIGHVFAFFNTKYFKSQWFLEESCEFYQKLVLSFIGTLTYLTMLKNISISKIAIFRYYAIRRIFGCIKEFVLDLEEFIRFRKTLLSINKLMKTPTVDDVNNLSDKTCIICRDEMKPEFSKMLSCCHIFHIKCLQNWLRRQYCCPTCLFPITSNNLVIFSKVKQNCHTLEKTRLKLITTSIGFLENIASKQLTKLNTKKLLYVPDINPDLLNVIFSSFPNRKKRNKLLKLTLNEEMLNCIITKIERAKLVLQSSFFFFYEKKFGNKKKIITKKLFKSFHEHFWKQTELNTNNLTVQEVLLNTL